MKLSTIAKEILTETVINVKKGKLNKDAVKMNKNKNTVKKPKKAAAAFDKTAKKKKA